MPTFRSCTAALFCLGCWSLTLGQSNDEVNSALQFNFSAPGARSLGFGGAFTARADDATAVYANPAGLVQLSRPEFAVEGRYWDYSVRFLDSGTQLNPGTFEGLSFGDTNDGVAAPSFLAGFYPSRSGRWVVGGYIHTLLDFETTLESQGSCVGGPCGPGPNALIRPISAVIDTDMRTAGVAFSVKIPGNVSLGAALEYTTFHLDSRSELLDALRSQEAGNIASLDAPTPTLIESDPEVCCQFGNRGDVIFVRSQSGDDYDVNFNLGFLWQSSLGERAVPLASVGAVYRKGPKFDFSGSSRVRSLAPTPDPAVGLRSFQPQFSDAQGVFHVPDVFGVGVSFRPSSRWVAGADVSRVHYSQLTDAFLDITGDDSSVRDGTAGPTTDFELQDGNEYRVGAEFTVNPAGRPIVFVRGGVWSDPDHELRYVGTDPTLTPVWSTGSRETHIAAGVGLRWRDFQFDVGGDFSDRVNTVSLSFVAYFGRR